MIYEIDVCNVGDVLALEVYRGTECMQLEIYQGFIFLSKNHIRSINVSYSSNLIISHGIFKLKLPGKRKPVRNVNYYSSGTLQN